MEKDRARREQENNFVWVNRLPTEILSRIFTLGEEMDHNGEVNWGEDVKDDESGHEIEFQELVVVSLTRPNFSGKYIDMWRML